MTLKRHNLQLVYSAVPALLSVCEVHTWLLHRLQLVSVIQSICEICSTGTKTSDLWTAISPAQDVSL